MKKIMISLIAPFAFISILQAQITWQEADGIVLEHIKREQQFNIVNVYAKAGVQTGMTIITIAGETIELDYACWIYYIQHTGADRYLVVNGSNGNLMEVNTTNNAKPDDLAEWRVVDPAVGIQSLYNEPAIVHEVKGANDLFVFELFKTDDSIYSSYIVPTGTLPTDYKKDGRLVLISGDITKNTVDINGYCMDEDDNTINLDNRYNTFDLTTMCDYIEGEVLYKPCPCEYEGDSFEIQGEACFFIDFFYDDVPYIVLNNYLNEVSLFLREEGKQTLKADICNFPDFAKKWYSKRGIKVYFEGILYPAWCPELSLGCRNFCGSMVLTKLEIKK